MCARLFSAFREGSGKVPVEVDLRTGELAAVEREDRLCREHCGGEAVGGSGDPEAGTASGVEGLGLGSRLAVLAGGAHPDPSVIGHDAAVSTFRGFPPKAIEFLRELEENNDRDWFKANRARYDEHLVVAGHRAGRVELED